MGVGATALARTPIGHFSAETVAQHLMGDLIYDQADRPDIRMRTCQISVNPSQQSSIYLYQEQARVDSLSKPYRQRVLRLYAVEDQFIVSESFRPIQSERWVGLCDIEPRNQQILSTDLEPPHCAVYLQRKKRFWVGETPKKGCPSEFRGAAFVRNKIILSPEGMKTYDQGFDANGKLIWGSDGKPYEFVRVPSGQ